MKIETALATEAGNPATAVQKVDELARRYAEGGLHPEVAAMQPLVPPKGYEQLQPLVCVRIELDLVPEDLIAVFGRSGVTIRNLERGRVPRIWPEDVRRYREALIACAAALDARHARSQFTELRPVAEEVRHEREA